MVTGDSVPALVGAWALKAISSNPDAREPASKGESSMEWVKQTLATRNLAGHAATGLLALAGALAIKAWWK